MDLGRSSPRHHDLAILYPRSSRLQSHINEYYIVTVRFCHEVLLFTRKSAFRQLTANLSGDIIRPWQSELTRWAREVKEELVVLVAKRVEEEAVENSRFRLVSQKFSGTLSHQQRLAKRLRILDRCSLFDYQTTWKQIRKSGNVMSFAKTQDYINWKRSTESSSLLYFGKLGSGKSVTMANIVDDVNLSNKSTAYFFFRNDISASLDARTAIGSLTRQLLSSRQDFIDSAVVEKDHLSPVDMLDVICSSYTAEDTAWGTTWDRIYLIIDGLDLCAKPDREEIVQFVRKLQEKLVVIVCVSIRLELNYEIATLYRGFMSLQTSSLPDNSEDIEAFIEGELERCLSDGALILGDQTLILNIQDALLEGSRGMFLWVVLQIKMICAMQTDAEIVEALGNLPEDLSDTYSRILRKAHGTLGRYQGKIFQLVISAQEPLRIDEIQEALSVTPGITEWNPSKIINDIYSALATCGCLIHIEEEELTVRFVHPSVKDFLLRDYSHVQSNQDSSGDAMSLEECHKTMANVIVTYLSYSVFDNQVSTLRNLQVAGGSTPAEVIATVTGTSRTAQSLALRLLAHRKRVDFDLGKVLASELDTGRPHDFVFQRYAKQWFLDHVSSTGDLDVGIHMKALLPPLLERNAAGNLPAPALTTAVKMAIKTGNKKLLQLLLEDSRTNDCINSRFEIQHGPESITFDPLAFSICKGDDEMVAMLLPSFEKTVTPEPPIYTAPTAFLYPPCHAVYLGAMDTAYEILTSRGKELKRWNAPHRVSAREKRRTHICISGRNLLACAVWVNNMDMLDLLLHKAQIGRLGVENHTAVREAVQRKNILALQEMVASPSMTLRSWKRSQLVTLAKTLGFEEAVSFILAFPVESSPITPGFSTLLQRRNETLTKIQWDEDNARTTSYS
jgi:hypothetical protein